jgi:hypothetical protein
MFEYVSRAWFCWNGVKMTKSKKKTKKKKHFFAKIFFGSFWTFFQKKKKSFFFWLKICFGPFRTFFSMETFATFLVTPPGISKFLIYYMRRFIFHYCLRLLSRVTSLLRPCNYQNNYYTMLCGTSTESRSH